MKVSKFTRFSLVIATINRKKDVERFLKYLDAQSYRDFELIIVDQNKDNKLQNIINSYKKKFCIKHIRENKLGVSHARNIGIKHATGDLIAFPDDDCWYKDRDLLKKIDSFFENKKADILVTMWLDENNRRTHRPAKGPKLQRMACFYVGVPTYTYFFTKDAVKKIGYFNESFGPGAGTKLGGYEDKEYLLRGVDAGLKGYFDEKLIVNHPRKDLLGNTHARKIRGYGVARGYLFRNYNCPWYYIIYRTIRLFAGIVLYIWHPKKLYVRWCSFSGFINGLMMQKK